MSDAGERLVSRANELATRIHVLQDAARQFAAEPFNVWKAKALAEEAIRFSETMRLMQQRTAIN